MVLARRITARRPALAACLVAVTSAGLAFGDGRLALTGPVRGVVVTNYGDLLNGAISIEVEQRVFGWLGVELGVGMKGFRGPFDAREVWPTFAFAEAGARLYPLGRGPSGVWFGPTARGLVLVTKDEGAPPRLFGWSLGGALGYHFLIAPRFVGQVALGAAVADFGAGATFEPRVRLGLGFTF